LVVEPDLLRGVERFRRRLEGRIPVARVILFGSRARGTARPDSDADVLVVSPAFEGKTLAGRNALLRGAWDLDLAVDFVCYTPAEFDRLRGIVSLVSVAVGEGTDVPA
jgi:predicted nucleotidyltransferase